MHPRRYEIHIRGDLTQAVLDELGDLEPTPEPAETVLSGVVVDQAALHGILDRLLAAGLEIVELRRLPDDARPA